MERIKPNLSEDDKKKLKEKYLIPEGTKETYKKELDFIVSYREKLLNVLNCFWRAKLFPTEENSSLAIGEMAILADELTSYMKASTPANAMRNLVFIKNIDSEAAIAQIMLVWYGGYEKGTYDKTLKLSQDLGAFYQYVCTQALFQDNRFENLRNESAALVSNRLKGMVEADFLKSVDRRNLCFSDIFYLIGHYKQELDKKEEQARELESKHCEGCAIDDCLISHCDVLSQKIDINQKLKKVKTVYDTLIDKAFSMPITEDKKREVCQSIQDNGLRQTVSTILDIENSRLPLKKRIVVDLGERKNICVERAKIEEYLEKCFSDAKSVQNWTKDEIASAIVLNDFDLTRGTGDKFYKQFIDWRKEMLARVDSEIYYGSKDKLGLRNLIIEYQNKSKLKNELGGE